MTLKRIELPPGDFLRAQLKYDPQTGLLYRRATGALATTSWDKYQRVSLNNIDYYAHRLIWRMEISEQVPHQIDHINEDKKDNRLSNLREATDTQNRTNCGLRATNRSGFKGVDWRKRIKKWRAQIKVDGKSIHLGHFDNPEDGHAAYIEAAKKLHGEFANDGQGSLILQEPQQAQP